MIINIILWTVFGALAGWIASMTMEADRERGGFANIIVGIAGALIGGWVVGILGAGAVTAFDPLGMLVAVLGAVILLLVVRLFTGRGTRHDA